MSLWNDLANLVFDGVGLAGFKSRVKCFLIRLSCPIPTIVFHYFSLSLLSVYRLVLWGWGLQTDRVYIANAVNLSVLNHSSASIERLYFKNYLNSELNDRLSTELTKEIVNQAYHRRYTG